jgi:ribosome-associated translation inhibitor RaiA
MERAARPGILHAPACSGRVSLFIQIHADNQVESDNGRDGRLEEQIRQRLARFEDRITDVEVHVSDINGSRGGHSDLRCTLEARVNGLPPIAVAEEGDNVDRAVIGAAKKAVRALDHQLGRLKDGRG